ncbi:hypothetical protein KVG88_11710 [Pseudomonas sp. SWRI74]|uniref:Delta-60 repeat domain-containing protein n=1 Tax=Pseudomonas azerbaijanoccidentalis TaxID=2842347 RepID=A0ABS6QP79_9PSED|nr:hypothetical protein [Pseudomonas azerbaijanoccidentalis]MBV4520734.1 hypothetical protein [Pseudomonas azerbaijanoccidentalis]
MSNNKTVPIRDGLDTAFADDGVAANFEPGSSPLKIVGRRANGKLVFVGSISSGIQQEFLLVQLLENGQLDPDFGAGGIVKGKFRNETGANATGAHLLEDGKILLIGNHLGEPTQRAFARFDMNGAPDPAFGDNGVVIPTPAKVDETSDSQKPSDITLNSNAPRSDTAIGPNGELLVATPTRIQVYKSDGQFERNIAMSPPVLGPTLGTSVNAITVAGHHSGYGKIARFSLNGNPDPSFGENGRVQFSVNDRPVAVTALLLRDDNSMFVAGGIYMGEAGNLGMLAAFNTNGQPNLVFNGGKPVVSEHPSKQTFLWSGIAMDGANGLIVTGTIGPEDDECTLIARYKMTGEIDISFGKEGFLETRIGEGNENAFSLLVQPDGKPIVSIDRESLPAVVRYLP